MSEQWQYQLRLYLADELAEAARHDAGAPVLGPLPQILKKHDATMKCQFDAFSDYVAQAEADGVEGYPLYEWTKATIEDPIKRCIGRKKLTPLRPIYSPWSMAHGSHVCPGTTQTLPVILRFQNAFASLERS